MYQKENKIDITGDIVISDFASEERRLAAEVKVHLLNHEFSKAKEVLREQYKISEQAIEFNGLNLETFSALLSIITLEEWKFYEGQSKG